MSVAGGAGGAGLVLLALTVCSKLRDEDKLAERGGSGGRGGLVAYFLHVALKRLSIEYRVVNAST